MVYNDHVILQNIKRATKKTNTQVFFALPIFHYPTPQLFPPSKCTFACSKHITPESIEWSIEDQNFLRLYVWYGSSPTPPPPTFSSQQIVSLSQSSCVSPVELTDERGERAKEPNHTSARKSMVLHNHWILSASAQCFPIPLASISWNTHSL